MMRPLLRLGIGVNRLDCLMNLTIDAGHESAWRRHLNV